MSLTPSRRAAGALCFVSEVVRAWAGSGRLFLVIGVYFGKDSGFLQSGVPEVFLF